MKVRTIIILDVDDDVAMDQKLTERSVKEALSSALGDGVGAVRSVERVKIQPSPQSAEERLINLGQNMAVLLQEWVDEEVDDEYRAEINALAARAIEAETFEELVEVAYDSAMDASSFAGFFFTNIGEEILEWGRVRMAGTANITYEQIAYLDDYIARTFGPDAQVDWWSFPT